MEPIDVWGVSSKFNTGSVYSISPYCRHYVGIRHVLLKVIWTKQKSNGTFVCCEIIKGDLKSAYTSSHYLKGDRVLMHENDMGDRLITSSSIKKEIEFPIY